MGKFLLATLMAIMCLLVFAMAVHAADGYDSITIPDSVMTFNTSTLTAGYQNGFCYLETGQVRFRTDINSSAVSATSGVILDVGSYINFESNSDIVYFKAIRTGAASGVLTCQFYR